MTRDLPWRRLPGISLAAIMLFGLISVASTEAREEDIPPEAAGKAAVSTNKRNIDTLVARAKAGDGQLIARMCRNCHSVEPGAGHKIGPNLFGIAGRDIATAANYPYSDGLGRHRGKTWTNETLNAFLENPMDWAPGTKMTFPGLRDANERAAIIAYLRALPDMAASGRGSQPITEGEAAAATGKTGPEPTKAGDSQRLVREGLVIDLEVKPANDNASGGKALLQGDFAEVGFRITDEATGEPVSGLFPGAYLDLAKAWNKDQESSMTCKYRAGLYLQGEGFKPLADMNSYFMLVMNNDASIMVFDPLTNVTGRTMLYAQINLDEPGADWVKSTDEKRIFVSMPRADSVAVIDTNTFKVETNIDAGVHPVRVTVQPDGRYLWVGNDSKEPDESGVTVIDVASLEMVAQIPTGSGHHEIAFSDDSRYAFVSNRKGGSVSVIDVQTLREVAEIETGPQPLSVAYSQLSQSLYVADGAEGIISIIDPESRTITGRIKALPGLGPLRFTRDGRWGLVVNTEQSLVHAIDVSMNQIAQDISVGTKPYQINFSRNFAYVRSLATERVSMINLEELNRNREPPIVTFQAGDKAPETVPELNLGNVIVQAPGEAAVMVVSPGDATVYLYMEGMNAPTFAFRNYGHRPLSVMVLDQALREKEPGVYASGAQLPYAGTYEIAFLMDSPQILHCFKVVAGPNPAADPDLEPLAVEFLTESRKTSAGANYRLRFQLTDPANGRLSSGLGDVYVLYYRAPGQYRTEVLAEEVSVGVYEAELPIQYPGAYYAHVGVPSVVVRYGDLPYVTFAASRKSVAKQEPASNDD